MSLWDAALVAFGRSFLLGCFRALEIDHRGDHDAFLNFTFMKYLSIFLLILSAILSSCSGRRVLSQDSYRIAHPELKEKMSDTSQALFFMPVESPDYLLEVECPTPDISEEESMGDNVTDPRSTKTHEVLSPSAYAFEVNKNLDSLLRASFPGREFEYLIPGLAVPENDSVLDSLMIRLRLDSNWNREFFHDKWDAKVTHNERIPQSVKALVTQLAVRYSAEILVLPVDTWLYAKPAAPCDRRGKIRTGILLQIWDGPKGELLYLFYNSAKVKVSGEEHNLNGNWTWEWKQYLNKDFNSLITTP